MDELIAYYENIFAMYDSIIGLDGSAVENKKSKSLFLKADISGAGGAYYGANWTANSSDSTKMWLDKLSWELYMKSLTDTKLVLIIKEYLQEKFLIIYSVFNINIVNMEKADQVGWLFNFGKRNK